MRFSRPSRRTVATIGVSAAIVMFGVVGSALAGGGHLNLTGKDIKNNTLTGADIQNGSVEFFDVSLNARKAIQNIAIREAAKAVKDLPSAPGAAAPGAPGAAGVKGDTGATGNTGAAGADGPQGFLGLPGMNGLPGIQGLKGDKGDQGLKGDTGDQGLKGDTGAAAPAASYGVLKVKIDRGLASGQAAWLTIGSGPLNASAPATVTGQIPFNCRSNTDAAKNPTKCEIQVTGSVVGAATAATVHTYANITYQTGQYLTGAETEKPSYYQSIGTGDTSVVFERNAKVTTDGTAFKLPFGAFEHSYMITVTGSFYPVVA